MSAQTAGNAKLNSPYSTDGITAGAVEMFSAKNAPQIVRKYQR